MTSKLNKNEFYWEGGKMIMTELYHIKRGSCCGNLCKHCPFSPPHLKMNKVLKEEVKGFDPTN